MNRDTQSWMCNFLAGRIGSADPLARGTKIVHIEAHKGRLYAGNGYWMDHPYTAIPWAQVLAIDSPGDAWRIDHSLGASHLRVTALKSVVFETDDLGNSLFEKVNLLLAGSDRRRGVRGMGESNIFTRDDESGSWVRTTLQSGRGYRRMVRAFFVHRDGVTGVDRIFVSAGQLGIYSGVYDPALLGKIRWDEASEFGPIKARPMSFAEANGVLYASVGTSVYRRVDGQAPVWEEVYTDDTPYSFEQAGIRGLTAVPSPAGKGESLLFSHTDRIIRMDPEEDYAATVELKIDALLEKAWRRSIRGRSIIAAYSDMVPVTDPATGQTVHLMGVQSKVNGGQTFGEWYPGAAYLIRYPDLSYRVKEVNGRWKPGDPFLVAIRAIALSPFSEDAGQFLYFGGFDANFLDAHDTAWIYRAHVDTVLEL